MSKAFGVTLKTLISSQLFSLRGQDKLDTRL